MTWRCSGSCTFWRPAADRCAQLSKRSAKEPANSWTSSVPLTRCIQDLDAVILQRAAEEQAIGVYPVRGGRLAEPFFLRFAEIASQPRSAEHIFREHFETESTAVNGDLGEHLWLVSRWYYSNPREGEIFFREKDWPYRRILRACSRLLTEKTNETETESTQGPAPKNEGAS
jgi:hypothetical protein